MNGSVGNFSPARSAPVKRRLRCPGMLLEPIAGRRGMAEGVVRRVGASVVAEQKRDPDAPPAAQSAADFCRQARRLRAVFEHDPVRMHRQLSRLSVIAAAKGQTISPPDETPDTERRGLSQKIGWAWTHTARLGRNGMTILGRLGKGLSMAATEDEGEALPESAWDEDAERYTLLDPDEPLLVNEGYPSTSDRSFREFVRRTLGGQRDLRYSKRLALLKEAGRRGIGRFEANLMIASVQHDLNVQAGIERGGAGRLLGLSGVLAFIGMQGLIVLGYWRLFRS